MLTKALLDSILDYEPDFGTFTWKVDRSIRVKAGMVAGSVSDEGYRLIGIAGKIYKAHRLAWLMIHGQLPREQLDHINGDRQDNRLANLREAGQRQNSQNQKLRADSSTGLKGVSKVSKCPGKFQASIQNCGKRIYLGCFPTMEEAHKAYQRASAELFGQFSRAA